MKLTNKVISGEIGLLYTDDPISSIKEKGLILTVETKSGLFNKINKEKIWFSMNFASLLELIPRDFGIQTDEENEKYFNKNIINKTLNLNLINKNKSFLFKKTR